MQKQTRDFIFSILEDCVERTIARMESKLSFRPFHEALLSRQLVIAAAFERSFSTSLGQGVFEEISKVIALESADQAERQRETMVAVYRGAIDEIERILSALRSGERSPCWRTEVKRVRAVQLGPTEVRRVLSDLWVKRGPEEIFISIKTVKPNLDQTEISKKDMLLLLAHNPNLRPYFCLPYNPGGENRRDYDWTVPKKIFDMTNDECVLIGREYWDMLGGPGCYQGLLEVLGQVGAKTRERLRFFI